MKLRCGCAYVAYLVLMLQATPGSQRPGGRLAIVDFPPEQGSSLPAGVPDDRGGHGIPTSIVVAEVTRAGFRHVRTMLRWPPDDDRNMLFLVMFEKP